MLLKDIKAIKDRTSLGGKGFWLAKLQRAGYNIPPTLVMEPESIERLLQTQNKDDWSALEKEIKGHFKLPIIIRSSAREEDGDEYSFAGQFVSETVRNWKDLPYAIKKCWSSYFENEDKTYRGLAGRLKPDSLSLLIQPHIHSRYAGVSTFWQEKNKIIVEYSQGGNDRITSGRGRSDKRVYDVSSGIWAGNAAGRDSIFGRVAELTWELSRKFLKGRASVVEWGYERGEAVIFQMRPIRKIDACPDMASGKKIGLDLLRILYSIYKWLEELGFSQNDWAIGENFDLLLYNYLGEVIRKKGDRLEHFRIWINPDVFHKRKWIKARMGGEPTWFPVLDDTEKKSLERLTKENIFIIFLSQFKGKPVKTRKMAYQGKEFTLRFLLPPAGISPDEAKFFYNSLYQSQSGQVLGDCFRIENNLEIYVQKLDLIQNLVQKLNDRYSKEVETHLKILRQTQSAMIRLTKKFILNFKSKGVVKGKPFSSYNGILKGVIIKEQDISALNGQKNAIFLGKDLEPSLTAFLPSVTAVIVSRGSFGSHAAAICQEFSIPLLLETENTSLLHTGQLVSIDFSTGLVEKIKNR